MITLLVFAIRDVKAEIFLPPFFSRTRAEAMRQFSDLAMQTEHPINRHPGDFDLFYIGTFEQGTGLISPDGIQVLASAADYAHGAQLDLVDQLEKEA